MMSSAMSPYRQGGAIQIMEKIEVKKTGLIPYILPPPLHKCVFPQTYSTTHTKKTKHYWLFTKVKTWKEEHKVLVGSLYRCPDCLKVYIAVKARFAYSDEMIDWENNKKARDEWLDKTGEFVDGES